MARNLGRLLRPRSIAAIGGHWAQNVVQQCQRLGFDGDIWPVNPDRSEMHGVSCYRSVAQLPGVPDAAFVGVNRHAAIAVVGALAHRGAGGAICFASGFSESAAEDAEGAGLQHKLLQAAADMPLIGPNCYGLINYLDGVPLWPDQHGGQRTATGVAILTQSSNIAISMTMQRRGLPIAYMVTAGNQAQTGLAGIAAELIEDERVTALGLHIEGFGSLSALEALVQRARALAKPIVALKVGRSPQARQAMVSHTNSLSGADQGAQALLTRLGIAQVSSVPAFLETLKLLHVAGPLPGRRINCISCSGGEAGLMADAALDHGLLLPTLSDTQRSALRKVLGERVALANPLDFHTYIWNDRRAMRDTYAAMMRGDADLSLLVLDLPRDDRCETAGWRVSLDALLDAQRATGRKVAVVATLAENLPEDLTISLVGGGIAPLLGVDEAMTAIVAAAICGESLTAPAPAPLLKPFPAAAVAQTLDENSAKQLLAGYGLCVPRSIVAESVPAVVAAAAALGYPVVLKGLGVDHKTDAGAVRVGLDDAGEVQAAACEMDGVTDRFLVEECITGVIAELLIGVVRDPAHGYVLTLAAGGVLTELMRDSVSLLLPATRADIGTALKGLRVARLLEGYRGGPRVDLDRIVTAIMCVARFVTDHVEGLEEIEVNPLMCLRHQPVVADALIRMRD